MTLTLFLMRADTSADSRKVTGLIDYLHGIAHVTFRKLMVEVTDVVAYGAALLALRYLALQAPLGLGYGLKRGKRMVYYLKVIIHNAFVIGRTFS